MVLTEVLLLLLPGRWSEGTCMWQSGIDPRDASWRHTTSQTQNQRFSAALAAADQAGAAAEQALQLVASHAQEVKAPTREAVLQAQVLLPASCLSQHHGPLWKNQFG